MQNYHTEQNHLMASINTKLFAQAVVRPNDVTVAILPQFAVTFNPAPTKLMNRKQYCKYSEDQQRAMLARIESSLRTNNPSITLIEIHYERCPSNKMIHFHALYEMPQLFVTTMENYYSKYDSTDSKTKVPWRHLDIQPVFNRKGWEEYIRKDSI